MTVADPQTAMRRYVVLLRAVNVGDRKAPMAALRAACDRAGFADVRSYVASGNLVFSAAMPAIEIERTVEEIVFRDHGIHADTIARDAPTWHRYLAEAPFARARADHPAHVHLCLSKRPPAADAPSRLAERATLGERFVLRSDGLWVDFTAGVGASKVTPAMLNAAAGSPVTARNWNTVVKLAEMVGPP